MVEVEERVGDAVDGHLLPQEEPFVARAAEARRREYAAVRTCARACLARLGYPPVPILPGTGRAPVWPAGVVGSMTHCTGYAAAAVGLAQRISAIGIDAEPDAPLPDGVLDLVSTPAERERLPHESLATGAPCWDRLVFSAKEAVYKAWFPVVGAWLDAEDVEIRLEPRVGTFTATLAGDGLMVEGRPVTCLQGRWARRHDLLVTAVVVPKG